MPIERLFTADAANWNDGADFVAHPCDDEGARFINAPADWSLDAARALSEALSGAVPVRLKAVEENTMPSWLWRRLADDKRERPETDARQIFDRAAGSAAYAGWKNGLFENEEEVADFHDETRFMLLNRMIALSPHALAGLGVEWAYGGAARNPTRAATPYAAVDIVTAGGRDNLVALRNSTVDTIIGGKDPNVTARWHKFLRGGKTSGCGLAVEFTDTAMEWDVTATSSGAPRLMIDALRFRRADGGVDVIALRQAARIAVMLLDLHYDKTAGAFDQSRSLAIGVCNISALLMASGIPYDSVAGRSTAAAICAIVTAAATVESARLARLLGTCPAFVSRRESALRAIRNRRRVAYGERNDYERVSILPEPLDVSSGADLALIAAARHGWDEAVEHSQQHGLRHLQLTALSAAPDLAAFMECSAQGIEPETGIVRQRAIAPDVYRREINPVVIETLKRSAHDPADIKAITDYAVGAMTLIASPGINHAVLRERGFDDAALARLENALPQASDIRHVFTPWILGEAFCRDALRVPRGEVFNPRFDILDHLGFSSSEVAEANAFCCGRGTVVGVHELSQTVADVFVIGNSATAKIDMAAAVQSFVTGAVELALPLSSRADMNERGGIMLAAWRKGVRAAALELEGLALSVSATKPIMAPLSVKLTARRPAFASPRAAMPSGRGRTTALMTSRPAIPKASARMVGLKRRVSAKAVVISDAKGH